MESLFMETPDSSVSFEEADTRDAEMHSAIDEWIDDLVAAVDEARASQQFQAWLDIQERFHDYSYRNTLLIKQQCPEATKVAGYRTWQEEFDRHVQEGESAIWIWAPIITTRCPDCENAPSYHEQIGCDYDETPPDEWSEGLVGFTSAAVFDISQTEGEPLPKLETEAAGEAGDFLGQLFDIADEVGVSVRVVSDEVWGHGNADGVCEWPDGRDGQPVVEVRDRPERAAIAGTLAHEYAHALLHSGELDVSERAKREIEAEAVAYIVGRHCGLDMSGSAFYLAAWGAESADAIRDRLQRISRIAADLIGFLEG